MTDTARELLERAATSLERISTYLYERGSWTEEASAQSIHAFAEDIRSYLSTPTTEEGRTLTLEAQWAKVRGLHWRVLDGPRPRIDGEQITVQEVTEGTDDGKTESIHHELPPSHLEAIRAARDWIKDELDEELTNHRAEAQGIVDALSHITEGTPQPEGER